MELSHDRIFDLMGTKPDDPLFAHFVRDLGEAPEILNENECASAYLFPELGLSLILRDGLFEKAMFELVHHKSGRGKAYKGSLPLGIVPGDNRHDVQRKLGLKPLASALGPREVYDLTPVEADFFFSGDNETVNLMLISYTPFGQDMA
jgi:hypothetical protein